MSDADTGTDAVAMMDAWRKRGDDRFDPVRFRLIEALARRATAHGGEARRILDDRLARLLVAYGDDLNKGAPSADTHASQSGQPHRGSLAELVDHIAQHAPHRGDGPAANEVETLGYFRTTWSRLSADRRLTQSRAKVPANAGPLNSHQLVHRSLTLMRDISPEYLHRFMSYVDALLCVEQLNGSSAFANTDIPHAANRRKTTRRRSG